jgi:hypothetical protein
MARIRNEELDQLAGEVLPERTVLSAVPAGGGANGSPLGLTLCNHVNQGQKVTGNFIAIAVDLSQCGLTNKGQASGLGLLGL